MSSIGPNGLGVATERAELNSDVELASEEALMIDGYYSVGRGTLHK